MIIQNGTLGTHEILIKWLCRIIEMRTVNIIHIYVVIIDKCQVAMNADRL